MPPAHGHSLSLGPNQAQNLERKFRQPSCGQPCWAHDPFPVLEVGKRNRLKPKNPSYSVRRRLLLYSPCLSCFQKHRITSLGSAKETSHSLS